MVRELAYLAGSIFIFSAIGIGSLAGKYLSHYQFVLPHLSHYQFAVGGDQLLYHHPCNGVRQGNKPELFVW